MARVLTGGSINDNTPKNLTNRLTPKTIFGSVVVPEGVSSMYVTGVAAGGRGAGSDSIAPHQYYTGETVIKSSPSGNLVVGNSPATATNASIPIIIDPVGKKSAFVAPSSDGTINAASAQGMGGGDLLVSDIGFVYTSGLNGGGFLFSTDYGRSFPVIGTGLVAGYKKADLNNASNRNDMRLVWIYSDNQIGVMNGDSGEVVSALYGASKVFETVSYAGGYFFVGEKNGTTFTSLYYASEADAIDPDGWSVVVINGASQKTLSGVSYGNGVYVAVYADGSIYTATDPSGGWVLRSSSATALSNIKFADGNFVAYGATHAISSTDGIAWSSFDIAAISSNSVKLLPHNFTYNHKDATWCIMMNNPSSSLLISGDGGITWSQKKTFLGLPGLSNIKSIAGHQSGLIVGSPSATAIIYDVTRIRSGKVLSTSRDGGNLRVIRQSDYTELLSLVGGLSNGYGGASDIPGYNRFKTDAGYENSGTPPKIEDISDASYGIKIPGGAAASSDSVVAEALRGGESIMSRTSSSGNSPGYGGGSGPYTTNPGGGGGEGVVRIRVPVTPGETILYSAGMPQFLAKPGISVATQLSGQGHISFEFE